MNQQEDFFLTSGTLYVVSTPIGNLSDLSPRAIQVLTRVDEILAEDTRSFSRIARKFSIATPTKSFFEHNERNRTKSIIEQLQSGKTFALVSEAGTPLISDPGYHLIKQCHDMGIPLTSIPGPCAAIAALSLSGFEISRFCFEGFLPVKSGKRIKKLKEIIDNEVTTITFESPFRILKTVKDIESIDPTKEIFIARELTKIHEELLRGPASEIQKNLAKRDSIKGEIVLIISAK
ncbi:MAG: 16S rRNA (cytidine(1402)-2'-O)-methyltransferase [Deltaproteobacteria bacterium]|nr:16S rRNA (cytidine(1402)-2'-O)-methyltransferase [Deltaproteobacteria bacterium]